MRCRMCGDKAAINMRQHKLALCKTHYLEWVPMQVEQAIRKYGMFKRNTRLLVAVSGGKDSLSIWDIVHRLGYLADGLYINLGIDEGIQYSEKSLQAVCAFADSHRLNLHVVDFYKEYGESIPSLAMRTHRGHYKPCSVCGVAKRHIMNRIARDYNYEVLITGHNLDDEVAVLFGNTINWLGPYLLHQAPVLEASMPGLTRKAKPLCRMYEREMAAYALLGDIDYVHEECPYSKGSTTIYYKDLLNKMEDDRPGAKMNFYLSFLRAKQEGLFSTTADEHLDRIHTCPICGQSTSAPGPCAFCRMFIKSPNEADGNEI